ncbi:MAG: hypothetical protein H5T84_04410 [Thermoleophilia bacterium]|nr:hypothetical protein [Thermoleophilia bacterium]
MDVGASPSSSATSGQVKPDYLHPYCLRVRLTGGRVANDPENLVRQLLEDIARRCEEAGCSVIGHIKCFARIGDLAFHCNLTSRKTGAQSAGVGPVVGPYLVTKTRLTTHELATAELVVDLAVLVYGLTYETVESTVHAALASVVGETGEVWVEETPRHHHSTRHHSP